MRKPFRSFCRTSQGNSSTEENKTSSTNTTPQPDSNPGGGGSPDSSSGSDSSGDSGVNAPKVKITVMGKATKVTLPAEPVEVKKGAGWSEAKTALMKKVSGKPGYILDSWHLGGDEKAPELIEKDTFTENTTVYVKAWKTLPNISGIQGGTEPQVKITFEVHPCTVQ